ncbi:hypothetical protein F8388_017787 [Cannabis sativa]|uniref:Disease resistance N-terminal domain-containing protein n=1 Tax=Cannabis sativa TaxID=3483 RepID=A0A7J6F3F6_CANSA|nr:hypothetical protein F8388_017787 [Cannabis sativa]
MAEGVLLDIAATLIEMLISSAFEEIGLLYGAKDKFQELVDTTKVIKGVLLDAEEKMVVDQSVKVWLKQLGDAFFLADDLVDKFHTKLLQHRVMFGNNKFTRHVCIFFSNSNQVREEEVIGREDEKREIIRMLVEMEFGEDVSFIPMVGIGGLGKTTLAQYC